MNISSEQFNEAYKKLPFVIREYLAGTELGETVSSVGAKYSLHVDTIGAVDREVGNMLLGFENPQQFVGELRSVGVSDSIIGPFVQELNEKIFMPLHQRVREAGPDPDSTTNEDDGGEDEAARNLSISNSTTTQPAQVTQQIPQTSAQTYAPPATPVLAQVPAYAPPSPYTPRTPIYTPPSVSPAPMAVTAQVPQPTQSVMSSAAPTPPNPPSIPNIFPVSSPVPPEQIGQPQGPAPVGFRPTPRADQQATVPAPTSARDDLHKILKEYGVDPYREPIEGETDTTQLANNSI